MRNNKVIAIMSSKGGAGKTVTTANLCLGLSQLLGKKILAIDTNISTASLGLHFNVFNSRFTLYEVFNNTCDVSSALHQIKTNLSLIPASMKFDRKETNFNIVSEEVRQMSQRYEVLLSYLSNEYDLIVLDTAPGFNTESVSAMMVADGIIMVSNPEYPALAATANLIQYAKLIGVSNGGLVLNKVTGKRFEVSDSEVERVLKIKIIGKIPFDEKVMESVAQRNPILESFPHSRAAVAYKRLTYSLFGKQYSPTLYERFLHILGN